MQDVVQQFGCAESCFDTSCRVNNGWNPKDCLRVLE